MKRLGGSYVRPLSGIHRGLEGSIETDLWCLSSLGHVYRSHTLGSLKRLLGPVVSVVGNKTLLGNTRQVCWGTTGRYWTP